MSLFRLLCVPVSVLTGCASADLRVTHGEIHHHLADLRRDGHARVETTSGQGYDLGFARVRDLVEGCPDIPPFREDLSARAAPCKLSADPDAELVVGERRHVDGGLIVQVGVISVGAGLVACAVECHDPWQTASAITLFSSLLGTLILTEYLVWHAK